MADDVTASVTTGDGWAVGTLDGLGEGPGFRKVRRALDVKEFGVNAIVLPAGYATGFHFHDEQEELYFVHAGEIDGPVFVDEYDSTTVVPPGCRARLDAFGSIEIDVD